MFYFTCDRSFRVTDIVVDIDECAEHKDNCSPLAKCINIEGHFTCVCPTGYEGNGVTCKGSLIINYNM